MIKTLRITTIIAAILAVGLFALPVVYGYRGAEQEKIEQFLSSPGVIEKFNSSKGVKPVIKGDQIPPLVKEARVFGLYLNPPVVSKPAPPPKPAAKLAPREVVTPDPPKSTAKFTLVGTSYYQSRPELSLAYIDEPGKGLRWVRQGAKVGHMLIEQVKDGSVVVKDNEKSVTLVPVRPPKTSLLKGQSAKFIPVTSGVSNSITGVIPAQGSAEPAPPEAAIEGPSAAVTGDSVHLPSLEETAMMEKLIAEVGAAMEADSGVDSNQSIDKGGALLDKFISELEAMRVPTEEAKMLDRLGKELNEANSEPNSPPNSKIPRSRTPPRPPR